MQETGGVSSQVEGGPSARRILGTRQMAEQRAVTRRAASGHAEPCSIPLYHSTTQDMYNNVQKATIVAIASTGIGLFGG